ncbi:MAG: 6-phospho-beta-glucosidase, partial [Endomicrobia bacterium]|nr:6-phospho-beta-glucosidase [Endomicrobiia bacterium]
RATKVLEIEKHLLNIYKEKKSPQKPKILEERGGAYYSVVAVKLISAIYNNKNEIHILNTTNNNTILDLEKTDSIETNCRVNYAGIYPVSKEDKLPIGVKGLIQQVKNYERLTVKSFVEKDRNKAYLALLNHPLIGDSFLAKNILNDIIRYNRKYFLL